MDKNSSRKDDRDRDYTTWCTLLVSCGDTTIATTGFDTSHQFLGGKVAAAVQRGYMHVGRYLVGENGKHLCAPEIAELRAAGLRLAPIYQRFNDEVADLTRANGMTEGLEALVRAGCSGSPRGASSTSALTSMPRGTSFRAPSPNTSGESRRSWMPSPPTTSGSGSTPLGTSARS